MNGQGAMNWLDVVFCGIVLFSVALGVIRGFVFELLSVTGWFVAYFAAQWLTPMVAPHLPVGAPASALNQGAAFALVFVVALLLWSLVSRLLRLLIQKSPLNATDRFLGGGFGVARSVVLLLAVATVVGLTPLAKSAPWQASSGAAWLEAALRGLKPVLPTDISRHLPA